MLASGDPFHYGVGAVLARHIDAREMIVVPAPRPSAWPRHGSAGRCRRRCCFRCTAARSIWSVRICSPDARILALTSDGDGPAALARLLTECGFGASRLTVLEALGGPRERIRATTAAGIRSRRRSDALNMVAIEVAGRARRARSGANARPRRRFVRARRPDHQARGSRGDAVVAGAAPRRTVVGHRRRLRLGRDRMDAGRSVDARDRDRAARRPRCPHPPQRRRLRRAGARDRRRRGAGCACRACATPRRDFHRRRRQRSWRARCRGARRCAPAAGSWSTP